MIKFELKSGFLRIINPFPLSPGKVAVFYAGVLQNCCSESFHKTLLKQMYQKLQFIQKKSIRSGLRQFPGKFLEQEFLRTYLVERFCCRNILC